MTDRTSLELGGRLLDVFPSTDDGGALAVHTLFDQSNTSAFGTFETAELTPALQLDFTYGINVQTGTSAVVTSGTVDTNSSRLRLSTGTNASGAAVFTSRKPARYRPGQGITARFTPLFSTGIANSTQIWGCGNATDGYFFGYNGVAFGILHRNAGADTWIAQSAWNVDKVDGSSGTAFTYNPTFGTPVMIKYPYLGFGNILFFIQNPVTSRWVLVHVIHYANTTASVQTSNPSLNFYGQAVNSGNTSNLVMYCGSIGIFLSGVRSFVGSPKWAMDNNKATITTETPLLTIRNAGSYNGLTNRGLIRLNSVSLSSSAGAGAAIFRLKINATLGGTPSYAAVSGTTADGGTSITSGNSVASYDTAGTSVSGGVYQWGMVVDNPNSQVVDLLPYDIFLAPGETGTFSGFSTNSATMGIAANWSEDI